jgi:hypothetical protein
MAGGRTFTEKTSAADKSIGFDYQYYYFLYKLLNLKRGQSVGLEVLDDVHTTLDANLQLLFQLKHTTSYAASGQPVNLTQLDEDLWKTLSNWAQLISDENDGRAEKAAQLAFIKKTEFHLVTNKSSSNQNQILSKIAEFSDEECTFADLRQAIESLLTATKNSTLKGYITDVLKLDDLVANKFFRQVRFELEFDDITSKVKQAISEKAIEDGLVQAVFERLDSNIREDNYINIKAGKAICISYEEFKTRYQRVFTSARNTKLTYYNYKPQLPSNLLAQRFVMQLLHIGDVDSSELELIAEYTTYKLKLARNLAEWRQTGQLVTDEINEFHEDVKLKWRNRFRNKFRPRRMPPDVLGAAVELLDDLRSECFKIGGDELNTELCNGELYHLSDGDAIGWHPDWEKL